jgi:hypothetical protein
MAAGGLKQDGLVIAKDLWICLMGGGEHPDRVLGHLSRGERLLRARHVPECPGGPHLLSSRPAPTSKSILEPRRGGKVSIRLERGPPIDLGQASKVLGLEDPPGVLEFCELLLQPGVGEPGEVETRQIVKRRS